MKLMLFILAGIVIGILLLLLLLWIGSIHERNSYPGAPACPYCGYRHPLVGEFGVCGHCAREIYGDDPM